MGDKIVANQGEERKERTRYRQEIKEGEVWPSAILKRGAEHSTFITLSLLMRKNWGRREIERGGGGREKYKGRMEREGGEREREI